MMWVVETYCDQIKQKTEKQATAKWLGVSERWPHRFTAEQDAKDFILIRARKRVEDAAKELDRAEKRLRNCERKFGFRL